MISKQMLAQAAACSGRSDTPLITQKFHIPSSKPTIIGGVAILAALVVVATVKIGVTRKMTSRTPYSLAENARALDGLGQSSSSTRGIVATKTIQPVAKSSVDEKDSPSAASQPSSPATPLIARNAGLTVLVRNFISARADLEKVLAKHNGYSAALSVNTPESGHQREFRASLRIPANELSPAIAELKSLGRTLNETQSGEEVTQQHVDLLARLQNSRETEQRLRAILQQRTAKIGDVLQVEEEISRVRGEIESMEADNRTLEHRVTFATVDLEFVEEYREQLNPSPMSTSGRLRNAFIDGVRNAAETVLGLILFLEEFGPATLIWTAIFGVPCYLIWRRYRRVRPGA